MQLISTIKLSLYLFIFAHILTVLTIAIINSNPIQFIQLVDAQGNLEDVDTLLKDGFTDFPDVPVTDYSDF
jgi:hypothetical protein